MTGFSTCEDCDAPGLCMRALECYEWRRQYGPSPVEQLFRDRAETPEDAMRRFGDRAAREKGADDAE